MRYGFLCCAIISSLSMAATITVDTNGTADFDAIQQAIDSANNGDIVTVLPGLYTGPGNRDIDFTGKAITVRSQNGPADCIIDCMADPNNLRRAFYFHSGEEPNSVLDGFTIINGQQEYGGAIYCSSSPIISNCVFRDNLACVTEVEYYPEDPNIFTVWSYGSGGALYLATGSNARIAGCLFSGNSTYFGGNAIHCEQNAPIIEKCVFSGNYGALRGGAINLYKSNAGIINCLFTENSSVEYGGAIACKGDYHTPYILQCTLSKNVSDRGGALDLITTSATISNSIFWDNVPTEITNTATGTANIQFSDIKGGWAGIGNIDIDPAFVGLANYRLTFGSPCIDSASNNPSHGLPSSDLDNNPRPVDGNNDTISVADMGAYELKLQPGQPVLAAVPARFRFTCPADGAAPPAQFLYVWNAGNGLLHWNVTENASWLRCEPVDGASAEEINIVELTVDPNGLVPDLYECQLAIADAYDSSQMRIIEVVLRVDPCLYVPAEYSCIQAAVDAAFDGDEIIVANGTYTGAGNRDIDFTGKAITVRSEENNPFKCVIDCQGTASQNHRGFYFHSGENENAVLSGFTVKNGYMSQGNLPEGGGILCLNQHTDPTITNCIIVNNAAHSGGGISCYAASPQIRNCIIANNEAYYDKGGGVLCWSGSNARIVGCTIACNNAKYYGGGTYFYSGSPVLTDSILWGNNLQQIKTAAYSALTVSYCDVQNGQTGVGNINSDPLFVDAVGGDYHISSLSPCRDTGAVNFEPLPTEVDIDAGHRKVGNRVDIGADEIRDLTADMDEDGDVGINDLTTLAQAWASDTTQQGWDWNQDLNKDGKIDILDFSIFSASYGRQLDPESPSQPQALCLLNATQSQVMLTWRPSTDNVAVTGYRIYRNGSYFSSSASNSFTDLNVELGSIYIYQVSAFDAVYNESNLSAPCIVTTSVLN